MRVVGRRLKIHDMTPEAALELWPDIEQPIADALLYDPGDQVSLAEVRQQLEAGYAQLLLAVEGEDIMGVIVLQMFKRRGQRVLHVLTTTGQMVDQWLDDLVERLCEMAQHHQCVGVTMAGRPGWQRTLARYGFRTEHILMRKEVEHEHGQEPKPVSESVG